MRVAPAVVAIVLGVAALLAAAALGYQLGRRLQRPSSEWAVGARLELDRLGDLSLWDRAKERRASELTRRQHALDREAAERQDSLDAARRRAIAKREAPITAELGGAPTVRDTMLHFKELAAREHDRAVAAEARLAVEQSRNVLLILRVEELELETDTLRIQRDRAVQLVKDGIEAEECRVNLVVARPKCLSRTASAVAGVAAALAAVVATQ